MRGAGGSSAVGRGAGLIGAVLVGHGSHGILEMFSPDFSLIIPEKISFFPEKISFFCTTLLTEISHTSPGETIIPRVTLPSRPKT